jgi:hypothetical protein
MCGRISNRSATRTPIQRRERWWRLGRSGADLREATANLRRVIATPRVAKHRFFAWIASQVLPDSRVNVIALDDDVIFGILQSGFHEAWSLRLGGWHGVGNDPQYTPRMGFETFAFPPDLAPDRSTAEHADADRAIVIAAAARRLDELRNAWLNPPDLVQIVPEVVRGFPDRILPRNAAAAKTLKTRTLTNLYNERPAWLDNAHATSTRRSLQPTAGRRTSRRKRRWHAYWRSTSNAPPRAGSWLRRAFRYTRKPRRFAPRRNRQLAATRQVVLGITPG